MADVVIEEEEKKSERRGDDDDDEKNSRPPKRAAPLPPLKNKAIAKGEKVKPPAPKNKSIADALRDLITPIPRDIIPKSASVLVTSQLDEINLSEDNGPEMK